MAEGGMTREHILLARCFGIRQLLIVVSWMDAVSFDQAVFETTCKTVIAFAKRAGFRAEQTVCVPVSVDAEQNFAESPERMPWYRGPTLLVALEQFGGEPEPRSTGPPAAAAAAAAAAAPAVTAEPEPFRAAVFETLRIGGIGWCCQTRVLSGRVALNDRLLFPYRSSICPDGTVVSCTVKDLEFRHEPRTSATVGQGVSINIRVSNASVFDGPGSIRSGVILADAAHPVAPTKVFIADIVVLHAFGAGLKRGAVMQLLAHFAHVPCGLVRITQVRSLTGVVLAENAERVAPGLVARVLLVPLKPIVMEASIPAMARFVLWDSGRILAKGTMVKVCRTGCCVWFGF
jgi:elongation factor 1-alpha